MRFPQIHIAESVVNRLLNMADDLEPVSDVSLNAPPPVVDPTRQSLQLDQALQEPAPGMPPLDETADPGATVQGKPLLATLLDPAE